jgi:hypothetical protein
MKKLIFFVFAVLGITFASHAQENTQEQKQANNSAQETTILKDTWNGIVDAYKSGEALEAQQKFAYGFLKQGVNTAVGVGGSIVDLPDNLVQAFREYSDVNSSTFYYFGKYSLENIGNSIKTIYQNIASGDPEKIGEATFDIELTIEGAASGWKMGKPSAKALRKSLNDLGDELAIKYGPRYHYTDAFGANKIREQGIQRRGDPKVVYATHKGDLSGTEAKSQLALPREEPPTYRVKFNRRIKPKVVRQVEPNFGQLGGGIEQLFYEDIPVGDIISIEKIPQHPSITTKMIRSIKNSALEATAATPYDISVFGTVNAVANAMSNEEGGHHLNAQISTVFFVDDTIAQGAFLLFDKDGIMFIGINPNDIDVITEDFINNNPEIGDGGFLHRRKRGRNEVIPTGTRTSRGL